MVRPLSRILRRPVVHDTCVTVLFLVLGTLLAQLLNAALVNITNISFLYVLVVVFIARYTTSYLYGIIGSLLSIVCINFFFTYPYMHLNFTMDGYPFAFLVMLIVSFITSATTTNLKKQARILAEREKELAAAENEKMRANLLRAISHDLRTPLTSIIGSANLYLENGAMMQETEKFTLIHNIHEDANWLLNMVENILSVTRINTADAKVTKTAEPVEEVVSEAVIRLKKRITDADIHVKVPDDFLMIPMDAMLRSSSTCLKMQSYTPGVKNRSTALSPVTSDMSPFTCVTTASESRRTSLRPSLMAPALPPTRTAAAAWESACPSVRQSSPHMTARSQPATFRAKSRQGIIFATLSQPPAAQNSLSRSHAGITLIQSRRNHYECKIIDLNH